MWVPGHCGVEQNEAADAAANTGRDEQRNNNRTDIPIDLQTAKTVIRDVCKKRWAGSYSETVPPDHLHNRICKGRPPTMDGEWSRREQVVLHQLRVNRCPLLRDTLRWWGRAGEDELCDACNEPEDTDHYITNCMKYDAPRIIHLGPIPHINSAGESGRRGPVHPGDRLIETKKYITNEC